MLNCIRDNECKHTQYLENYDDNYPRIYGQHMMTPLPQYNSTISELVDRITVLVAEHPEILTLTSAWDLLNIPELNFNDLEPSLFQVSRAVYLVQQNFNK